MTRQIPHEYHGREQTYLKHRVLAAYLRAWGQKLGSMARSGPLTIFYVDCFAGPWRSQGQQHEDTSVAIGLHALSEAITFWRVGQNADLQARAIFVESNPQAAFELRRYVAEHAPTGVDAEVIEGTFGDLASKVSVQIGKNPAFIFVDPTGWKGVGIQTVARLARGQRRDVMINVMFDHINRFKDDERGFLQEQMGDFFGMRLEPGLSEIDLMSRYRDQLKVHSGLRFAADLAVLQPTRQRTYFRLVLGAGHPKALELFRDVEYKVCGQEAASVRAGARNRRVEEKYGQTALGIDAPNLDIRYGRTYDEDLRAGREALLGTLKQHGDLRFGDVWPQLLERHHVRLQDLKDMARELASENLVVWHPSRSSRQRTVQDDDLIALPRSAKNPS